VYLRGTRSAKRLTKTATLQAGATALPLAEAGVLALGQGRGWQREPRATYDARMGRFDGRVALVTGGGSGIGEATCRRLAPTLQRTSPGRRVVLVVHHLDSLIPGRPPHIPLVVFHSRAPSRAKRRQSKLPGQLAATSPDRSRAE
jgi:hypothetical protein